MTASRRIAIGFFLLAASAQSVRAEVVFGNLGNTGSGGLNGTNTDIIAVATQEGEYSGLAQGFTTGSLSQFLKLESVVLGLFAEVGVPARTVSLFSDNAGVPGSELAVSNAVSVSAVGKYTFGFSNYQLAANTSYWIVPQPDVSWHLSQPVAAPIARNSSGYAYLGSAMKTFESGNAWTSPADDTRYSISVQAVPEPSTVALGLAGVAGLVGFGLRRRISRGG
jgi:hypothetical protein